MPACRASVRFSSRRRTLLANRLVGRRSTVYNVGVLPLGACHAPRPAFRRSAEHRRAPRPVRLLGDEPARHGAHPVGCDPRHLRPRARRLPPRGLPAVRPPRRAAARAAEIKVGTYAVNERAYRAWTDQLLDLAHPGRQATQEDIVRACSRWHYSLHFSRGKPKLPGSANAVADLLQSQNAWTNIGISTCSAGPGHTVYPARLIRTLDVAGNENSAKTELFAPSLRWLRSLPRPAAEPRPLLLSIHAGEDFAHLLSGIRHIEETVQFCGMSLGDRIGHGLALGIKPAQWFNEHGHALVPIDEHFDNVVWAWHYADSCPELPAAKEVARAYAGAARQLAPHVRWLNFGTRSRLGTDERFIVTGHD